MKKEHNFKYTDQPMLTGSEPFQHAFLYDKWGRVNRKYKVSGVVIDGYMFDRTLTEEEKNKLSNYFAEKYGLWT
jgi:hypothetical protein